MLKSASYDMVQNARNRVHFADAALAGGARETARNPKSQAFRAIFSASGNCAGSGTPIAKVINDGRCADA
jgi:hypothetical protein